MQVSLVFGLLFLALCNARTIVWTNAGGNPLWNNPGNWDCSCLPTADDDVVIDIQSIAGNVLVGGGTVSALAKSLKIGGTSKTVQTLTINGPISVGSGSSSLALGSVLSIETSPDAPFKNEGTFNIDGSGFIFASGALAGSGSIVFSNNSVFNLTGAAAKTISTNIVVNGVALTHSSKSSNIELKGGKVVIAPTGSFTSISPLSLITDTASSFTVSPSATFAYKGPSLTFQGSGFNFGSWNISPANGASTKVQINNGFVSGNLALESGVTITLIGAPTEVRTFDSVTGKGGIIVQGGVVTFKAITANSFQGFGGNATVVSGTFQTVSLSGAFLAGTKASSTSTTISGGFLTGGLQLSTSNLDLRGTAGISDDGTSLTVVQNGVVGAASLLTLTGGSSFVVASGASLKQTSSLQIVQGAPQAKAPQVTNNGAISSSAAFSVSGLTVGGTGTYNLASGTSYTLTNVQFSASALSSQGNISLSSGAFNVATVTGTGSFNGNPNNFVVSSLACGDFKLAAGTVSISNGTLSSLSLINGAFNVATSAKIGTFTFFGGKLVGSNSGSQATVTATTTAFKGAATQTLTNVAMSSGVVTLDCATGTCQLFTSNAALRTLSSH